ncbi:hypothetical protein [Paenibacillus flagellatus]|uniref:Uncharacterized protein n=1 Tax=Paenibacillus flagellatus TaxID=2211139 RepID=A0A2V5KX08_9BACL|nr:hypothetical protein [Paenibacillus flagellatus]PYI54266.1 hypothetical protein DLM86_12355 [Paenibacillus flagellatus]
MGTKFGNVHVMTNELEAVLSALKDMTSAENGSAEQAALERMPGFGHLLLEVAKRKNIFYIAEWKPGWITILNDCFGWGETEAFGETLSGYIGSPVFTFSYFDDDVFEMNVFANGETLTGHGWQSLYADYEMEEKSADVGVLSELLGHEHVGRLLNVLETDNPEQAAEQFESILQIPIWIHSDWFDDLAGDETIRKYTKYDFNRAG